MLPHAYRTLAGRPGGRDGRPVPYQQRKLESAELYDLRNDIGETEDVAAKHPEIVERLQAFAAKTRNDLGDTLTKHKGTGLRQPGRVTMSRGNN
jgi:arylsulfatase A